MKIVIDRDIPFIQDVFENYFDEVIYAPAADITPHLLKGASALVVRTRTYCNEELLQGSGLRFIATATVGTDHIDLNYCRAKGIEVFSAQGCNKGAVLQWVLASLTFASHHFGLPLQGRTLGVVGYGNIGRLVERAASAMGMYTMVCDPIVAENEGRNNFVSLHEIAQNSDFITFHVPLTFAGPHHTFNMADEAFFSRVKPDAFILNSSRGGVMDENTLIQLFARGKILGTAIDVWYGEPIILDSLLQNSIVATPHIAGYSIEGKVNATRMVVNAIAHFFQLSISGWQPASGSLLQPVELDLNNFRDNNRLNLNALIARIYDVGSETKELKAKPNSFEKIRNSYSYRRENSGYLVRNCSESEKQLIEALGFVAG